MKPNSENVFLGIRGFGLVLLGCCGLIYFREILMTNEMCGLVVVNDAVMAGKNFITAR